MRRTPLVFALIVSTLVCTAAPPTKQRLDALRTEAAKLAPPTETGDFRTFELVEPATLDASIKLDVRYASTNNFLGAAVYTQARVFLQRPAAEALVRAARTLRAQGYGLLLHDGYRPWRVTWIFWQATPPDKHDYVADPARGSRHNRGCAIDLTLYDLKTGHGVDMPSLYDEMSERAHPGYAGATPRQRANREALRAAMEREGFTVNEFEWWHYDYKDWPRYRIGNVDFEQLSSTKGN